MEIANPVCCGLDVHKAIVVACLRTAGPDGTVAKQTRTFGTTYDDLLACRTWLVEAECPIVGMESTGVYWKPVFHVLSGVLEVVVGNARDIRVHPGRKTDKRDADWIAELLAHGLIRPSFIPPPSIRALRDLTRTRVGLIQARTQAKNRVHKLLEDSNIKLATVVSDLFGKSARRMLDALVAGERNAQTLARLAMGRLLPKIPALELALVGQFTEHHAFLLGLQLRLIDAYDDHIEQVDTRIAELTESISDEVAIVASIPGVKQVAARGIVAEIGTDMTRFVTSKRLTSWARICPGTNESAGKRFGAGTGRGNRYLRRMLVQCAWAARRTDSFLGDMFRRHQARIGAKKAAVAVAHKILVIVFHLLRQRVCYDESRIDRPHPAKEYRRRKALVSALERLGFQVELTPQSA